MGDLAFSFDEVVEQFEREQAEIRAILLGHPLTAPFGARLEPGRGADSVFTLAVVGQMRVGKSSLINALMERDMAITGVNETTATINWFRYSPDGGRDVCRVHWKGRPAENVPVARIQEWVGDSARAQETECLEFFSDSPYLKVADVVDTPGARSVIESHEDKLNEFLAGKMAAASEREAGRADAIVYVLPPVARESDEALLGEFERSTRIPGSTPYNSLGVLHKWDAAECPDPVGDARRKAAGLAERMSRSLSGVIAVSAPLYRATLFDEPFWETAGDLARAPDERAFGLLTQRDADFKRRTIEGVPLGPEARTTFWAAHPLPWASLRLILRIGRGGGHDSPAALRAAVLEASGMGALKDALRSRFFSRARIIKLFSALAKVLEPCRKASLALHHERDRLHARLRRAEKLLSELSGTGGGSAAPPVPGLAEFIRDAADEDRRHGEQIQAMISRADAIIVNVREQHRLAEADMSCLEALDAGAVGFPGAAETRFRRLFGQWGTGMRDRLAWSEGFSGSSLSAVRGWIGDLRDERLGAAGESRRLVEHAIERLEMLAHQLTKIATEDHPNHE